MTVARRHFLIAFAVLSGGLLVTEALCRLILGLGSPPLLRADEKAGYVFQANQNLTRFTNRVRINRYHQRSNPPRSAPDSTFIRILFLGDSVTWGGVLTDQSETFPEFTEDQVGKHCEQPVESLNASAGSWGIGNLLGYATKYGLFDSDAVVLQIGTNDLTQPRSSGDVVGNHPSAPSEKPPFAVAELVNRYLAPRLRRYLPDLSSPDPESPRNTTSSDSTFQANLQAFEKLVLRIQRENIPVTVVHTPNRNEVAVSEPTNLVSNDYRQSFLRKANSLQVPVLNLAEAWRGRSGVASYYRDRIHLNEKGNQVLADTLSSMLRLKNSAYCSKNAPATGNMD
jgi:lysophospholipase L1-like esterase